MRWMKVLATIVMAVGLSACGGAETDVGPEAESTAAASSGSTRTDGGTAVLGAWCICSTAFGGTETDWCAGNANANGFCNTCCQNNGYVSGVPKN